MHGRSCESLARILHFPGQRAIPVLQETPHAGRLVARVWGADTHRRGRATLQTHISRLRGALAIVHRSDGYTLEMDQPEQAVDLLQFRTWRDQARDAGEDTPRVALLTEALALWRDSRCPG